MSGILFFGALFGYIFLSKFIINRAYKVYKTEKAKNIALAIMILIPTWDIILGFPIYAYLCVFESGTKIYKTVDNVEGFYVGKKDIKHEPYEPYDGYKYIDYKEMRYSKPTGKYYRSYWVDYYKDRNTSDLCISPNPKYPFGKYAKIFKTGNCIVKKEITENEISQWEVSRPFYPSVSKPIIPFFIYKDMLIEIIDRDTKKSMSKSYKTRWQGGWLWGIASSIETGHPDWITCNMNKGGITPKILKPKLGVSHDNN